MNRNNTRINLCIAVFALLLPVCESSAVDMPVLCSKFSGFDQNRDGRPEIQTLRPIARAGQVGKRALVLVESRLLNPLANAPDLTPALKRMVNDLADEGYQACAVSVTFEPSTSHQDGAYLLAIREFLRAAAKDEDLAGVILVGRFPDALLIRTCNWFRHGDIELPLVAGGSKQFKNSEYMQRRPEIIAPRADIVLSDLNGKWEDIYVQQPIELPRVRAIFEGETSEHGGPCVALERGSRKYQDFFNLSDGELKIVEMPSQNGQPPSASVILNEEAADRECESLDLQNPNHMAHPDIMVSRLDARGSAWRPKSSIVGVDGKHLLDDQGRPQTVQFASKENVPNWRNGLWEPDPMLERRLLAEYLDRNHAYRTGRAPIAWRVSSIACDLGSGYRVMSRAATGWDSEDQRYADIWKKPTLTDFMDWMRYPAVLRTLRAHSEPSSSVFKATSPAKLDAAVNGQAWSWTPRNDRLEPSLASACGNGRLNWFLLRSLWENGVVAPEPSFYLHTGCEAVTPPNSIEYPFDNPAYGARQGAEALLFFGNGLTLVGRAKVYYDEPSGFADALREGRNIGEAWARYFDNESKARSWSAAGGNIGRKKAYFWSVLGDWSLKLTKPASHTAVSAKS